MIRQVNVAAVIGLRASSAGTLCPLPLQRIAAELERAEVAKSPATSPPPGNDAVQVGMMEAPACAAAGARAAGDVARRFEHWCASRENPAARSIRGRPSKRSRGAVRILLLIAVLPGFVHCRRQRGQALLVFLPLFGSELELNLGVGIFHRLSIRRPCIVSDFLYWMPELV